MFGAGQIYGDKLIGREGSKQINYFHPLFRKNKIKLFEIKENK